MDPPRDEEASIANDMQANAAQVNDQARGNLNLVEVEDLEDIELRQQTETHLQNIGIQGSDFNFISSEKVSQSTKAKSKLDPNRLDSRHSRENFQLKSIPEF